MKFGIEQMAKSKAFKEFYKEAITTIEKNYDKNHNCKKVVPFRWWHVLISTRNKRKFCYNLDPRTNGKRHYQDKIHYKLYLDIIDWFWENADEVLDYQGTSSRLRVNEINRKLLSVKLSKDYPILNIGCFLTRKKAEMILHDNWLILYLTPVRASKLNTWLISRGWPDYSIVYPEECPGFLKKISNQKDDLVILNSLIEWNMYRKEEKDKIINHYNELGYKYFPKSKLMMVQQCNRHLLLKPCNFLHFNKNNEEGGYYLI